MSQNNNGYQDLIINNGVITTMSNLVTSDNNTLQGIQMNQFAICANPGSAPVLVPYITPMILSPHTTKMTTNGNNQDNRSQNGQIQLSNNITIPSNMINPGNLPFGLSYINLSQLTSQTGGTAIPIQLALNTGPNQQFTLPLASITQLTNDLQINNAYTLAPQIKFEPDIVNSNDTQITQIVNHNFQNQEPTIVKSETETRPQIELPVVKRGRKKIIVRKPSASQPSKRQKIDLIESDSKSEAGINDDDMEVMYDHKGRPFMFPCDQCPKKFTQNSRLTAHLRCHSGIRPYTCTQCGFSFTQKSYLIRHAAVHKEDRPFTCSKCMKTYKHYGSLANHRKLHCREGLSDGHLNGSRNHDRHETDDLDETIQQTIESVQMNHQNNYILTYTSNSSDLQSNSLVYFNNNGTVAGGKTQSSSSLSELQLSGTGPVVFPSQELPSISAVSLLPTNRSAINELKAITTHLANNVDVDAIPAASAAAAAASCIATSMSNFQHHIKQEPTYFTVTQQSSSHNDNVAN